MLTVLSDLLSARIVQNISVIDETLREKIA